MDVLLLSRLLKELIIDNDRIPLPGMGYFQTEPMPAYFSEDGKTIYPPSKRISFKGDDRAVGDLVAKYYAAGTGMDDKTAATELEAFLQQLKLTLQERKNIEFPGLGRLRCTLEGNAYFVAEQDGGIFAQAFGFEPVTLKPIRTGQTVASGLSSGMENTGAQTADVDRTQQTSAESGTRRASDAGPSGDGKGQSGGKTQEDGREHSDGTGQGSDGKHTADNEKKQGGKWDGYRIWYLIMGILAAIIVAAVILVALGRSGKLDRLIYSDEELELLEQHGL